MFFKASDGLWKTDGTESGTVKVKGLDFYSYSPYSFFSFNNNLFFSACSTYFEYDPYGYELWRSDGTAAGTFMVKDLYPGYVGSVPSYFEVSQGLLFFSTASTLCKSDGTATGTVEIPLHSYSHPENITDLKGRVLFTANYPETGRELMISDGTENGTFLVKDIMPGKVDSKPSSFIRHDDFVIFSAINETSGRELWRTDGTEAGTYMIKDIQPGRGSGDPRDFFSYGSALFFCAYNEESGYELWKTDGTETGTVMVKDFIPGEKSSFPRAFSFNSQLYFTALDGRGYNKLWYFRGDNMNVVQGEYSVYRNTEFVSINNILYFSGVIGNSGVELLQYVPLITDVTATGKEESGTKVYPNPASEYINIVSEFRDKAQFCLIDATGRKVLRKEITGNQTRIDLRGMAKGIYCYIISTGTDNHTGKLIIR